MNKQFTLILLKCDSHYKKCVFHFSENLVLIFQRYLLFVTRYAFKYLFYG